MREPWGRLRGVGTECGCAARRVAFRYREMCCLLLAEAKGDALAAAAMLCCG